MGNNTNKQTFSESLNTEYSIIKKDLFKVVFLNALYLIAIIALYFTDKKNPFLITFFEKIFKF